MATKTFEELKQLAIQIRDEKTNKQNTATRIGTQMLEHLNKLEKDYYDKTATDEELKQRDEKLTELSSGKQDKLIFDRTPTLNSDNPVTSGGVRNAIDVQKNEVNAAKDEAIEEIGKKEQSAIINFNSQKVTPEMLSESTKQLIEASGGGTITNLADDEDIKSEKNDLGINVLKFADRKYDKVNFSGKGYKILRKNIVEGKNVLTQNMLPNTNTIYVIRYDFDLNGVEIIVPENCTLQFESGSLSNGVINATHLNIIASYETVLNDVEINGTLNPDLQFIDIWSNKPFLRTLSAIKNLVITRDWTIKHTTDWVYHALKNDNTINIYGNGHTLIFDTNNQDGTNKTTFIAGKYVYIENLNIIIKDDSTKEKIATIIDCTQCILNNVYFYGYNRLAVNWSYVNINEDTKLYVSNCRLYTTSFIFEHIFSEVEIYDSTIEVLREIRSDYNCKVISCSAYRNDEKSKVIIKNSNILGEWELVYNGDTDFRNGDIYNYKQFDIYNSNLKLFNITYDDSKLINSNLVANYYNCNITKYLGCNLLNGIKEINHYNCDFTYSSDINIYGLLPFSIISADVITFNNCNFIIDSNSIGLINFREEASANTNAFYRFVFDNCSIIFNIDISAENISYSIIKNSYKDNLFYSSNISEAVSIKNLRLVYENRKQVITIITNSDNRYLIPAKNSLLNSYVVENYNLTLLQNFFVINAVDRILTFYNGKFYPKEIITYGTTEQRPTYYSRDYEIGFMYFDTTLSKPIWWNGSKWVDATGAKV